MALDLSPYPTIPGGFAVAKQTASDFKYTFIAKQEAFEIEARGLLPSTLHFVFFENKRVANNDLKPLNGKIGDLLYTDANGKISFVFYYRSDIQSVTSEEAYAETVSRIGGDKEIVIASADVSVIELPEMFENIFTSYAKKNIFFKTSKVSELPVKSNYTFAYPEYLSSDDGGNNNNASDGDGSSDDSSDSGGGGGDSGDSGDGGGGGGDGGGDDT